MILLDSEVKRTEHFAIKILKNISYFKNAFWILFYINLHRNFFYKCDV